MSKIKRQKISIKRDIDLNAAADFISNGVDAISETKNSDEGKKPPHLKTRNGRSPGKYPWEDAYDDMTALTPIPTVSLPKEYTLKLDYIMRNIGFTKQFVCRSAIMGKIDNILNEYLKRTE